MNPTTAIADSVARLTAAGAHLVLCRPDKRPLWRGWQRRWPGADTARAHLNSEKGPLGVVPASLRSTALDVDTGDPLHLFGEYPPWADIPSRRGHHAYYETMIVPVETPRGPCTDAAATYAAAGVILCSTRMVLSACPTRSNVAPSASIAYRVTCSSWPDTPLFYARRSRAVAQPTSLHNRPLPLRSRSILS